jgi:electron transfer flavoprotein beta subunit
MRIVVLVKQVPDTWGERELDESTGRLRRDPRAAVLDEIGERALEVALRVKDDARDTEVVAITMGPETAESALRTALAAGADRGVLITDDVLAGSDLARTAVVLAEAVRAEQPDLVVSGDRSTDGASGVLPAMLSEHLGLPLLDSLDEVRVGSTGVAGARVAGSGVQQVQAALPAVVSVTERAAEPRFAGLKGILGAKRKPVDRRVPGAAEPAVASIVLSTARRPDRGAGTIITDDGTAADQLIRFLSSQQLLPGRSA